MEIICGILCIRDVSKLSAIVGLIAFFCVIVVSLFKCKLGESTHLTENGMGE